MASLVKLCKAQPNEYLYIQTCIYVEINTYLFIYLIHIDLSIYPGWSIQDDLSIQTDRYVFISVYMHVHRMNILWDMPHIVLTNQLLVLVTMYNSQYQIDPPPPCLLKQTISLCGGYINVPWKLADCKPMASITVMTSSNCYDHIYSV